MNRATVLALVLGVHALFVLLLLAGNPMAVRMPAPLPEAAGFWIRLDSVPPPVEQPLPADESNPPPAATPRRAPQLPSPLPRTAITLPASSQPATEQPVAQSTGAQPVDWQNEAARIAAEITGDRPTSIGKPLEPMREPCKPRVSSLWGKPLQPAPEKPPAWQDQVEPSAEVLTGVSRHTIKGGIGIPLGRRKPRDDLFDDMLAGATPRSSVPDPNICD